MDFSDQPQVTTGTPRTPAQVAHAEQRFLRAGQQVHTAGHLTDRADRRTSLDDAAAALAAARGDEL